jgi:hypothetical protein
VQDVCARCAKRNCRLMFCCSCLLFICSFVSLCFYQAHPNMAAAEYRRYRRDPLFLYKSTTICEDCWLVYAETSGASSTSLGTTNCVYCCLRVLLRVDATRLLILLCVYCCCSLLSFVVYCCLLLSLLSFVVFCPCSARWKWWCLHHDSIHVPQPV